MITEKKSNIYLVKNTPLGGQSVKDVDLEKRIVTGVFNAYNFVDDGLDVLIPGCCKMSIKTRGPESNAVAKIKHLLFHDLQRLPGKILTLTEGEIETKLWGKVEGLLFSTKMDHSTEGNDTLIKYQEEVYDNHSIGYSKVKWKRVERDGQHGNSKTWDKYLESFKNPELAEKYGYFNALEEIELYEGSTVAFGMNELTPYLGVKGKEEVTKTIIADRMAKLKKVLSIGTLSDDTLKSAELQMLQLEQIFSDLCERVSESKEREILTPTNDFFKSFSESLKRL